MRNPIDEQRERKVEDHLRERVKATGGFTRKMQWLGFRGAPDRLCGWPNIGRFGMVELKCPKTPVAEEHQAREHKRLRDSGIRVDVLPSIEAVDAYVAEMTGQPEVDPFS